MLIIGRSYASAVILLRSQLRRAGRAANLVVLTLDLDEPAQWVDCAAPQPVPADVPDYFSGNSCFSLPSGWCCSALTASSLRPISAAVFEMDSPCMNRSMMHSC
jgi:hypothetical protein